MTAEIELCPLCPEGARLLLNGGRHCPNCGWREHPEKIAPSPDETLTPLRACFFDGKVLMAAAGFIETIHQPDGLRRDFCDIECLHWQLHEDMKQ